MAADRDRAAVEAQREKERNEPSRQKREVEAGATRPGSLSSAVRRPVKVGARRIGGVVASSANGSKSSGGSAVKRPNVPRRPGRVV